MKTIRPWACGFTLLLLSVSCAEMYAERPVGVAIDLTENCAAGPYCVTGAVTAQNGTPVAGVRCVAEWSEEEPTVVYSNRQGLFLMSGLSYLPRKLRFEKDGFETQPVSVVAAIRQRLGGADSGAGGNGEGAGAQAANTEGQEGGLTQPLLGDNLSRSDELSPEELFDFGSGSTMRVLITMRRVK